MERAYTHVHPNLTSLCTTTRNLKKRWEISKVWWFEEFTLVSTMHGGLWSKSPAYTTIITLCGLFKTRALHPLSASPPHKLATWWIANTMTATHFQVEQHLGRATQSENAVSGCSRVIMQRWVVSVNWGVEPCKVRRLIAMMERRLDGRPQCWLHNAWVCKLLHNWMLV